MLIDSITRAMFAQVIERRPMMATLFKRADIAAIVLQLLCLSAAAEDLSPERSPTPLPGPVAPASSAPAPPAAPSAAPNSPPAAAFTPDAAARPIAPAPVTPAIPQGGVKPPAVDVTRPAPVTPLAPTKGADAPGAPATAASSTRSLPAPAPSPAPAAATVAGERKPALDIDMPANLVGPNADTLRRQLAPGQSLPTSLALRSLKRMTPQEILTASHDAFSIYVLRDSERTLVLDFPNTREQAKMFARLILFIERAGASKTRVMTVPEVQKWLSQNAVQFDTLTVGNNMKTGELARFFNSARFQGEPVTTDEQKLYDWLILSQLLREEDAGVAVVDPERILVSVPQVSSVPGCAGCTVSAAQRAVILQHELSHARFATDTVYQNYTVWFWSNAMSLVSRDKFTRFLRSRGYDTSIRELCANEMQAFLMNTPDPSMFSASDIGVSDTELADLRRRFQEGIAPKPRASAERPYQFD